MANGRPTPREASEKLQCELDYASGWFQYTASQRLTTFNFFLIVVGLLLVAFAQAIDHAWDGFGMCIATIGLIVSIGFLVIDVRNEVLVEKGLGALRTIEAKLEISLADRELDGRYLRQVLGESVIGKRLIPLIGRRLRWPGCEGIFKYRFWFRTIISAVGIASILGFAWAQSGFPKDEQGCRKGTVLLLHRRGLDLSLVRRSEEDQGEQRGADHDGGRPDDGLGGDFHVQTV